MKIVASLLLVLLVSIQTPVGQLFKLPLLVEHFIKHQEKEGDSLFSFLNEHYASPHHDADLPEDEQLPFKSIDFFSMSYAIVPGVIKTNTSVILPVEKKVIFPEPGILPQYSGSIFHPPRLWHT